MGLIVSGLGRNYLNNIAYYIFVLISLTYISYRFVLVFFALKQWLEDTLNGKTLVRYSPIDMVGTALKYAGRTFKTAANFTVGAGFVYVFLPLASLP